MRQVLVSAPYMLPVVDEWRARVAPLAVELVPAEVHERLEEEALLALAGRFDGIICGDDRFTPRVIDAWVPRLRVISKWGTGIDSIDKGHAEVRGVRVCNTPNAFTEPVADSVMAYLLAFARRLPWQVEAMRRGEWEKLPSHALGESTLGIIGVGNIGSAVARRALGFGMRVLGTDPRGVPEALRERGVLDVPLDALLAESQYVTLNCDLNPSSLHLMNAERLRRLRPGAVLINTSRGSVVDEPALVAVLEAGRLAGAALDVFEVEPLPLSSPLRRLPNVLGAAHNSNSSPRAWAAVHRNTVRQLLEVLGADADAISEAIS